MSKKRVIVWGTGPIGIPGWGIGDYLGIELDRIEQTLETRSLPFDYEAAWGQGKANTIAAVRWTMTGYYKHERERPATPH